MPMPSDLSINVSPFRLQAVSKSTEQLNDHLIGLGKTTPKWREVGIEKFREMRRNGETPFPKTIVIESGKTFSIPSRDSGRDILCRVFEPESGQNDGVYMHIHGGGWVVQSEADQDPLLKSIANDSNVSVISIGYRLAPENPFPKGPEDCFDAAEWLVDNAKSEFGADLKFMGGESAGGHLSLLTLFRLFKSRPAFHFLGLVLNYGAYDLSFLPQARNFPKPLLLNLQAMMSFMDAFCPGLSSEERSHPSISPFYQDLSGLKLPPALFTCGTEDCLLDDTMMMALRWQMNGAEAVVRLLPAAPHGYLGFPRDTVENADEGLKIVREFLLEMLG
ncbi:hypothetical protein MMC12_005150 [Toensbergia leucococca]|nr:hypothetical protein [Toensbergia leucococca]